MAKLTIEQITEEVEKHGYSLIDASGYTNMDSPITIQCEHGHLIETNLRTVRHPSFCCPQCDKTLDFKNPKIVPEKTGYRIIAFDQATEHFGLSIFDDGKLVFCRVFTFTGTTNNRLVKIRQFIKDIVIDAWKPDFIEFEDIQYQNGYKTFKVLAMLFGIVQETLDECEIPNECVSPNVWRKHSGVYGKTRAEEKRYSVQLVKDKYNISVNDDTAEAVLIGRYAAATHKAPPTNTFGNLKK